MHSMVMEIKDRLNPSEQSGLVYRIPYPNCPRDYTGKNRRVLGLRIHEHTLVVIRGKGFLQVAAHTYETDHEFNLAATKILVHARSMITREFIKTWASDENPDLPDWRCQIEPCALTFGLVPLVSDWPLLL
ncbi:unnamed protein product [Schistocephalus solidus]|uniref:Uncharacterized protein n=1 Tax=Schistocephalus solidus TaxID=70667 RepID=A0A183SV85_SCHSO|nr:unnamed protein product [Schistocephalus solidus]